MPPSKATDGSAAGVSPGPTRASGHPVLSVEHQDLEAAAHHRNQRPEDETPGPVCVDVDDLHIIDADVSAAVGRLLDRLLAERTAHAAALDSVFACDLAERVTHFTLGGGKRTRPQFLWWALRACGGATRDAEAALRVGVALELIQTCALVHDDVMDGSRLRRGRLALHADVEAQYAEAASSAPNKRFGEAAAILAGDLALAWADDVFADTDFALDTAGRVRSLWSAMRTEMVAGQYLDIQGQTTSSRSMAHAIRAACLKSALYSVERPLALGAALAGASTATTAALCAAGRCAGIAFQLRDDLRDVFGSPRHTGKPSGGDIRAGKPTYLVAVAWARATATDDHRALATLERALGCANLSEDGLTEVRSVLVGTGAQETVEAKIERLVAQGMRHLDTAELEPEGRRRLRELLHSTTAPPRAPWWSVGSHGAADGMPGPLPSISGGEGASP
ncbi:polyprenyl synthetase family protein [Streptomyces sp. NPDC002306]